jgi:hypothetical protein
MLADTLFRSERSVLLGPEGGLDASRPVECAHRIGEDTAWVCAAFVRDPVAVRAALARRAFGSPTVLRSMESLARGGSDLAVLAGLGPVLAEWTIAAFEQRGDEFETGGPQHARAMLLSECARSSWLEAGGRFEAHLSIADREGPGNDWDLELALLTGDRLVLFGSLPVARDVLARPPAHGESLAESEVFGRLAEIAPPGPASLRLIRSAPEPGTACVGASCGPMTTDFVVSDRGIDILVRASTGERTPQANDLRAYLPADAVSTFRTDAWETPIDPRDSGSLWVGPTRNPRLDPLRVALSTARRVAFAWGEIEGDPDPSGWIGAFDAGDRSAELLAAVGLPADETEEVRCGPVVCGVRRGDVVVLASHADGVAAALRRASVGTPSDADVRLGCLDGARAARLFRRLPAVSAFEGHAADFFRVMLLLVESAGAVWTDQTPGPAPGTHSRIRPPLRDVDDGSSAVGMLLVAGEIPLPRALRPDERCRGVRYRLRLPGAAYFLESDPFDPGRASATVLDEDHLEVIVVRPKEDGDQPLSPEARERHLADGFLLGTSDPSVAAQADELGAGRLSDDEYVARVVGWVHDHMVYERTVEDADAPTLLRRRRGDCSEFARLAVALLRAAGVPAVLASGFLADGGSLAPHAWIRWHDGRRWREADPTAGSVRVSAEYLPTSLLGMIGLLSSDTVVEAIEACARDGSDPDEEDACR